MWNPTSPVTGLAQSGFTAPTYTFVPDVAPSLSGKQVAVTALGGTQVGVTVHSASSPFTSTFVRPKALKMLGAPSAVTGRISAVPNNSYSLITRKGVVPAVGQPPRALIIRTVIDCPAGSELYDAANVRAALALHFGLLSQQSAGTGDTVVNGVM